MSEADPASSVLRAAAEPAFGQADILNCEGERIHLSGMIQPHGALLVVREPDHVLVQASANAASILGLPAVLGRKLRDLGGDIASSEGLAGMIRRADATFAAFEAWFTAAPPRAYAGACDPAASTPGRNAAPYTPPNPARVSQ
jgi:hypothetical protein